MDRAELRERLRLGEDSFNEFKSVAAGGYSIDPTALAKEVAALANTRGGRVFLGVEDDGTVSGIGSVEQADRLMTRVAQACQTTVQPPVACAIAKVDVDGRPVLLVEVPAFSPERPHLVAGRAYVRDANVSRPATRDEQIRMLESADYHFDEQPVEGSRWEDIEGDAAEAFLADSYDPAATAGRAREYLRRLGCLDDHDVPTVAGLLLFGREPTRWLPDARITALRLPGTALSSDFLDRKELTARLSEQVEAAAAFVTFHVPAPSSVDPVGGLARVERGIPPRVLREALVNAITHRNYRAASQVRVFVFDDRVEIVNPGALLNRLTLDGIRVGGISQRRNPVIASLLARLARRENVGIGVPEMIRLMRERGLPEPEFQLDAGHFRIVLRGRAPTP